jgi:hypothetical protein
MAIRYFHRAAFALMDPTRLPLLRDQVLQGLANQVLFARVLRDEIAPLAAASVGKTAAHDVDYIGISQGGILGSPLVALSPDIRRATLHVGGGGWTPMMTHSSNWRNDDGFGYGNAIEGTVPDATARTLLMALWQSVWDEWDPALFAPYWLTKPSWSSGPAPRADRSVYYPYAIADPQVPNFASETVMRSAGIALLSPSITEPFGIALVTYPRVGPGAVAAQWDVGPGEAAHGEPRKLRAFAAQVAEFIRSGGLLDPCGGQACKFDLDTAIRD